MGRCELRDSMAIVRELHEFGATRVKVGDIEADFPLRLPDLPPERPEREQERSPADEEKEMRRIATASGDSDEQE